MKRIGFTIAIVSVGLFILGGFWGFVFLHEQAHVQINAYYGIQSEVEYGWFVATTTGDRPCPSDSCILAHSINESISYPLQMMFGVQSILLGVLVIFKLIEMAERDLKREGEW